MKILFLSHRTPYPPNKGEKIRAFHVLSNLVKHHDVTLVYWVDDPSDFAHTSFLRSLCRGQVVPLRLNRFRAKCRALFSLLRGRSFSEGYYSSRAFQSAVRRVCSGGGFDVVYAFSSSVAFYARKIESKVKIVDFVDVDSDKWGQLAEVSTFPLSILYRLEQKRLLGYELEVSRWADRSVFISATEAQLFKAKGGAGTIDVLPSGMELELRRLPRDQVPFCSLGGPNGGTTPMIKVIFVGTMNYYPNVDAASYFAKEIFPLIRQQFPKAEFIIVGRSPAKAVRQLKNIDGVFVVGEVRDTRPYLLSADVSVAPMRLARGVQYKVLEAMAMGIPVVATAAAIQGIDVRGEEELLVGNSAEGFAAQVIRLLSDAELRKTITKRAWNKMHQLYSWDAIGAKLEAFLTPVPKRSLKDVDHAAISFKQG